MRRGAGRNRGWFAAGSHGRDGRVRREERRGVRRVLRRASCRIRRRGRRRRRRS